MADDAKFDQYAAQYDVLVKRSLSISGEDKDYFAQRRLAFLANRLRRMNFDPQHVLDFGCGTGTATPFLLQDLGARRVTGVDVSEASIAIANQKFGNGLAHFFPLGSAHPRGDADLAYCSGVFHHIAVGERADAVRYVHESLRPDGLFSFWEHNPWNPGTRYSMSQCPFDDDAVPITAIKARELLSSRGFQMVSTDFLFIFPRLLRILRPLEEIVRPLPIGAQYQILCRKR